jgi:hypothetical protein
MLEEIKILSSRRAYEFRLDDLRLTTLSIKPMQEQIQQLFQFQSSAMGTPMQTFGEVPITYPPGFVFNMGWWISQEQQIVPIRFLHFEQRRIVIDIAGPSSFIDAIAERLFLFLSDLRAADGSPVVGKIEQVLNYSEISVRFSFSLDTLFAPAVRKLFAKITNEKIDGKEVVPVPALVLQELANGQVYSGVVNASDPYSFTLAIRAGTQPQDHIYFSAAPLDSDAHLAYLNELDATLRTN